MPKSDARSTLEFAVQDGLAERAHLTGARAGKHSEMQIQDILASVFAPNLRWAVRSYLAELEAEAEAIQTQYPDRDR